MARSSFISHTVNGYSRYDVPESKAFTCTPGILYPVRIDFINARDRVTIAQGIDVRSNPLAVPSFNPYTVRLHRFWVPLQLYHPEMRTNSSNFDMNSLSLNWIPAIRPKETEFPLDRYAFTNSLMSWLRVANSYLGVIGDASDYSKVPLPATAKKWNYVNADTYVAYWDIVRNYYGFSQWGLYSFAWPASWYITESHSGTLYSFAGKKQFFTQRYGNLQYLDAFYESQFYPNSVTSTNNTYNRANLFFQIIFSDIASTSAISGDGYPVTKYLPSSTIIGGDKRPASQFDIIGGETSVSSLDVFLVAHPMAVVPSNPDRFSRLLPTTVSSGAVKMQGIDTIPQLAIASRLQEYKDLLGAGGSRFSDWLETFFASKIEHVDRPKLLFSASQTVNVQVVMNQGGYNNNIPGDQMNSQNPLGQMGGSICFNTQLGRKQSYYFREPGYMIDMLSIRPVYYWAGVLPDYLGYDGADYFNPVYNDIGYQLVANGQINPTGLISGRQVAYFAEPCFNEFRSSYDEVLGQLQPWSSVNGHLPLYAYWVQQRIFGTSLESGIEVFQQAPLLFVDMHQVNSPFVSNLEDNFFVNLSYSVSKKSLVNKTFATRLSNR